jgi:hypothetical protein
LKFYKEGDFYFATQLFEKSKKLETEKHYRKTNPSTVYLDRCQKLLGNPPSNWEGIWSLLEK